MQHQAHTDVNWANYTGLRSCNRWQGKCNMRHCNLIDRQEENLEATMYIRIRNSNKTVWNSYIR
jgi:hypothetical protein